MPCLPCIQRIVCSVRYSETVVAVNCIGKTAPPGYIGSLKTASKGLAFKCLIRSLEYNNPSKDLTESKRTFDKMSRRDTVFEYKYSNER